MRIYTKKGDFGETDIFDPKTRKKIRVAKDSLRIRTFGTIDEAVSLLGIVKARMFEKALIEKIQKDLFRISSILAGFNLPFPKSKILFLEKKIDELEKKLGPQKGFLVPGANLSSSYLHLSRAVVRRGERLVVTLSKKEKIKPNILIYLNRLSDLLFTLARNESKKA
jgi:cob(I)alamin adenosyltransferase